MVECLSYLNLQKPLQDATTEWKLEQAICALRKLEFRPLPGFDPNIDNLQYYRIQQKIDCDEVYPSIYIGNE
jgi:atypical dual specificity phosphatase/dual specificity phosphatase 3